MTLNLRRAASPWLDAASRLLVALAVCAVPGTASAQGKAFQAVTKIATPQSAGPVSKASVKSRNAAAPAANPTKPALVGTFGDWGVYVSQSPKSKICYIKNAAEENQFVATLKKRGSRLVITVPVAKGPGVTDTYSLAGLSQALDRVSKECP